jgi:hypothetical protein
MGLLSEEQVIKFLVNFQRGFNKIKHKPAADLMLGMLMSAATNEINGIIKKELENRQLL